MILKSTPLPQSGFVKLGCLGLLVMGALIWNGGQAIYTALKNREPLVMSFQDYYGQRPSAEWIQLTEAQLNFVNSAYVASKVSDQVKEIYVAVEAVGARGSKPAYILLHSKDPELIARVQDVTKRAESQGTSGQVTSELIDELFPAYDVNGLVQYGIKDSDKARKKLAKLDLDLEKEYIIIEHGASPSLTGGILSLCGGLILGYFLLIRRGVKDQTAAPPPLPN